MEIRFRFNFDLLGPFCGICKHRSKCIANSIRRLFGLPTEEIDCKFEFDPKEFEISRDFTEKPYLKAKPAWRRKA